MRDLLNCSLETLNLRLLNYNQSYGKKRKTLFSTQFFLRSANQNKERLNVDVENSVYAGNHLI